MPDHHRGRRSMYEHSKTAASAPGDEAGPYSWMQLEAMNERFRHAVRSDTVRWLTARTADDGHRGCRAALFRLTLTRGRAWAWT
jgi:hypothetical protein